MIRVPNSHPTSVFSFVRVNDRDKVFCAINFSDVDVDVQFSESLFVDQYVEYLRGDPVDMTSDTEIALGPWEYRVWVRDADLT